MLAVAFLVAMTGRVPAEVAAEVLTGKQTVELLTKPLGDINLPRAILEKRITDLRAIAEPLGIRLTLSKGVEAAVKRWTYPAVALKDGNLALALRSTIEKTRLRTSVRPGEVHLILADELQLLNDEIQKQPNYIPESVDEGDPFK
jgi:hypothetical protein